MNERSNTPITGQAFVTGGTGFVGINLIRELIEQGWQVTALHREGSDLRHLQTLDVHRVTGDINDAESVHNALADNMDAVFHVAGDTNFWTPNNARQTRINVDGTRNVVAAAQAKGARRLVLTSTLSAYGRHAGPVSESTPSNALDSFINYEKSKYQSEQVVREAVRQGLDAVIMQPGAIMGPYDTTTWAQVFFMLRDGKLAALPPGGLPVNHVRQIVRAHITAWAQAPAGSEYILGGQQIKLAELFRKMADIAGLKAPALVAPKPVLALFARVLDAVSRLTGKEPDITPETAAFMGHDNLADASKAKAELGYEFVDIDTCIQDSYDWLKQEKLLQESAA